MIERDSSVSLSLRRIYILLTVVDLPFVKSDITRTDFTDVAREKEEEDAMISLESSKPD